LLRRAQTYLPQACRFDQSWVSFEARVRDAVPLRFLCNSATVQGWLCVQAWYCSGTVVGPRWYPSRCRNLVSHLDSPWPCSAGRQKVEWSGVEWNTAMGMRFCHTGQEPSRSLSAERSRSVILRSLPPFSPSGPSMPSLTHVAPPLAIAIAIASRASRAGLARPGGVKRHGSAPVQPTDDDSPRCALHQLRCATIVVLGFSQCSCCEGRPGGGRHEHPW
jgi:hypothetical protein